MEQDNITLIVNNMIDMQHSFNLRVHPEYEKQGYNWKVAMVNELAEGLGYTGWEWWKKTANVNIPQLQLEIIDTWHFMLSDFICEYGMDRVKKLMLWEIMVSDTFNSSSNTFHTNDYCGTIQDAIMELIGNITTDELYMSTFLMVCALAGISSIEQLYKIYIGKNALNFVRQNNGYKDGSYVKLWDGINEDNVFLFELIDKSSTDEFTLEYAKTQLDTLYKSMVNNNTPNELVKQVIILRKDLGMRKGKMIAQGAHASLGATFAALDNSTFANTAKLWRSTLQTKIACGVNSEDELTALYAQAMEHNLPCCLITDEGLTEFHNIPTITALAIGPATESEINVITGNLSLI